MGEFLFLYPFEEYFTAELERTLVGRAKYSQELNRCIDQRYRRKGFRINYAVFSKGSVSDIINLQNSDNIIDVGIEFSDYVNNKIYPSIDLILDQLKGNDVLRIAGFHMWDCVEKVARRAYERDFSVLVDEDLTEFFSGSLEDPDFQINTYPSHDVRKA